jgi:hypothetical protein
MVRVVCNNVWCSHPVEGLIGAAVGMNCYTAISLDHHEAQRLRETRFEPSGIFNSAPSNEESHNNSIADWASS